jgi:hypothetical protein
MPHLTDCECDAHPTHLLIVLERVIDRSSKLELLSVLARNVRRLARSELRRLRQRPLPLEQVSVHPQSFDGSCGLEQQGLCEIVLCKQESNATANHLCGEKGGARASDEWAKDCCM